MKEVVIDRAGMIGVVPTTPWPSWSRLPGTRHL